jgi:surface polysaccharide O-acyltransferase-like enzyme
MGKVRTNQLIECMRYIACVLICFIHVPFPKPFSSYVILAGRAAVPFFLLLSGYFACSDDPVRKVKKKLRDTVRIVLTAGTVCFLWNFINCFLQNQNLSIRQEYHA